MDSNVLAVGQISLKDLNDAIISDVRPANPHKNQLWIDESVTPAMIKKWTGTHWKELGELDPDLSHTISEIHKTLGNMADDDKLDVQERQIIKDKLADITGKIIKDTDTLLPTYDELLASEKGSLFSAVLSATYAGLQGTELINNLKSKYQNLRNYLQSMTPIKPWDTSDKNKDTYISVDKSQFRNVWLEYYRAIEVLMNESSKKVKENVDGIRDDLDNLKVASRNILGNSKKPKLRTNNATEHPLRVTEFDDYIRYEPLNGAGLSTYSTLNDSNHPIYDKDWLGKDMVVSMAVRVSRDVRLRFRFSDWGKTPSPTIKQEHFNVKASDGWVRISFHVPSELINRNPDTEYIRFLLYTVNSNGNIVDYSGEYVDSKEWKIAFGTKDSGWSPAPEDTQLQLDDLVNRVTDAEFKIEDDRIVSLVTGSETYRGDFDGVNNNIDNLMKRMTNAEQKILPDAIISTVTGSTKYLGDLEDIKNSFGNLVKNPVVTNSTSGWSGSGLSTATVDFQGVSTRVLRSITTGNVQYYSSYFDVDPSKAYEVSLWIKKSSNHGQIYFGLNGQNSSGSEVGFESVNSSGNVFNSNNTNFYFYSTSANASPTEWVKLVGYIMPSGTDPKDLKGVGTYSNAIMKPNTSRVRVRWLNWDNGTTSRTVWVANPKVIEVSSDMVGRTTEASTKISQLENEIDLRVKTKDYNGNEIVSMLNLNSTTFKVKASRIEFDGHVFGQNATFAGDIKGATIEGGKLQSSSTRNGRIVIEDGKFTSYPYRTSANIYSRVEINDVYGDFIYAYTNSDFEEESHRTRIQGEGVTFISDTGKVFAIKTNTNGDAISSSKSGLSIIAEGRLSLDGGLGIGIYSTVDFTELNGTVNPAMLFRNDNMISTYQDSLVMYVNRSLSNGSTNSRPFRIRSHDNRSTFRDDFYIGSNGRIYSPETYETTSGNPANIRMGTGHYFLRSTSARKYKTDIKLATDINPYNILKLKPKSWIDKGEYERNGRSTQGLKRYYGIIADEMEEIGLSEYVDYHDGEVENIVERAWTLLIPIVKDHNDTIKEMKETIKLLIDNNNSLMLKVSELEGRLQNID